MLWHSYYQVYDGQCHQNNFKVLVVQQLHKKLEEPLRVEKNLFRICINRLLDCNVNLINHRCSDLPVIARVKHLLTLSFGYYILEILFFVGSSCHKVDITH